MKKGYFMMAAFATMLAFTACSNNDDLSAVTGNNGSEALGVGEDIIEISISNTGVGTSRATRPVGSSAAANNVNKVELKFYSSTDGTSWTAATGVTVAEVDGNTTGFTNNVIDFTETVTEDYTTGDTHIEETKKVKLNGLQTNTKYRIVAYGYNGDEFPYGTEAEDATTKGLFSTGNHSLSGYNLEEVFAGYVDASTKTSESKFASSPVVTLTRQVAGILAYFKIPVHVDGEKVEVVKVIANDKSSGFKFPNTLLTTNIDFNGIDGTEATEELIVFDMSECAANYSSVTEATEYYTTDNTTKGYATDYSAPTGLKLVEDAFFGARYILPYAADATGKTLQVIMYGDDSCTKILKTLNVVTDQSGFTDNTDFDIRCNNFYSIGQKLKTEGTHGPDDPDDDGEDEGDKEEDDDDPIDLGASDKIIVRINDAWKVLHNMTVEEDVPSTDTGSDDEEEGGE